MQIRSETPHLAGPTLVSVAAEAVSLSRRFYALAFVDVARLNFINRQFGTQAGEAVLTTIREVALESFDGWLGCQLWGDQVFLGLPNTSLLGTVQRLRAFRQTVFQRLARGRLVCLPRPVHAGAAWADVSIGISDVVEVAGANLQASKKNGSWLTVSSARTSS